MMTLRYFWIKLFSRRSGVQLVGLFMLAALLAGCADNKELADLKVLGATLHQAAIDAEHSANYRSAVSHYRKLWNGDPDNEIFFLSLARNLRYIGLSREAVHILENDGKQFSGSAAYQLEFAKALLAAEKSQKSIQHLILAMDIEPENWQIYSTLGIVYDRAQYYRNSANAYEMALNLSPDNPTILNNMAISNAVSGNLAEAIRLARKAAQLDRKNVQIRQNLALFLGIRGKFSDAEALAKMDMDEATVRNNMAIYYRLSGKEIPDQLRLPLPPN